MTAWSGEQLSKDGKCKCIGICLSPNPHIGGTPATQGPTPVNVDLHPMAHILAPRARHLYLKNFQPSYWRSKSYPRERQHARPIARKNALFHTLFHTWFHSLLHNLIHILFHTLFHTVFRTLFHTWFHTSISFGFT